MMQFTMKLEHYSCMLIHSRLGFPDIDDENLYYLLWTIMKRWTQVHGFKMKDPMRLEYDMASSVLTYTRLGICSLVIDSTPALLISSFFVVCVYFTLDLGWVPSVDPKIFLTLILVPRTMQAGWGPTWHVALPYALDTYLVSRCVFLINICTYTN
jgi:hypothetical protein